MRKSGRDFTLADRAQADIEPSRRILPDVVVFTNSSGLSVALSGSLPCQLAPRRGTASWAPVSNLARPGARPLADGSYGGLVRCRSRRGGRII